MTKRGRWFRKMRRIQLAIWRHRLGAPPESKKELSKKCLNIRRHHQCFNGRVFKQRPETMTVKQIENRLINYSPRKQTPKMQRRFQRYLARIGADNNAGKS